MSSSLPIGWENRSNSMSEKDMKLGGIAATKFVDKRLSSSAAAAVSNDNNSDSNNGHDRNNATTGAYFGAASGVYQNSDQVREHYLRQIEHNQQQQQREHDNDSPFASGSRHGNSSSTTKTTTTPAFWEERQQMRELEAEGFRNQGNKSDQQQQQQQQSVAIGTTQAEDEDVLVCSRTGNALNVNVAQGNQSTDVDTLLARAAKVAKSNGLSLTLNHNNITNCPQVNFGGNNNSSGDDSGGGSNNGSRINHGGQEEPPLWAKNLQESMNKGFATTHALFKSQKGNDSPSDQTTLIKIATQALEELATAVEGEANERKRQQIQEKEDNPTNFETIPMEDRAAFAKAIQRAMQALAKEGGVVVR